MGLSFIWGNAYLLTAIVVADVSPGLFVVGRHVVGAVVLAPVFFVLAEERAQLNARSWLHFGAMGVIGSLTPFLLLAWGQQAAPSGLAALMAALVPPLTLLLAAVLRLERLRPSMVLGVGVSFIGAVLVSLEEISGGADVLRVVALGAASVGFASGNVYSRRWLSGYDPRVVAGGQMIMVTVVSVPVILVMGRGAFASSYDGGVMLAWLALGVFATGLAYIFYHWLARELGPTGLSLVSYLVPVIGLISGIALLGEDFHRGQLLGVALILGGVAMSSENAASSDRMRISARRLGNPR